MPLNAVMAPKNKVARPKATPRARDKKVGIQTARPPSENVIMDMPSVTVQKAGLWTSPRREPRPGVSGKESLGPRSGSRVKIIKAIARRNPGTAAIKKGARQP